MKLKRLPLLSEKRLLPIISPMQLPEDSSKLGGINPVNNQPHISQASQGTLGGHSVDSARAPEGLAARSTTSSSSPAGVPLHQRSITQDTISQIINELKNKPSIETAQLLFNLSSKSNSQPTSPNIILVLAKLGPDLAADALNAIGRERGGRQKAIQIVEAMLQSKTDTQESLSPAFIALCLRKTYDNVAITEGLDHQESQHLLDHLIEQPDRNLMGMIDDQGLLLEKDHIFSSSTISSGPSQETQPIHLLKEPSVPASSSSLNAPDPIDEQEAKKINNEKSLEKLFSQRLLEPDNLLPLRNSQDIEAIFWRGKADLESQDIQTQFRMLCTLVYIADRGNFREQTIAANILSDSSYDFIKIFGFGRLEDLAKSPEASQSFKINTLHALISNEHPIVAGNGLRFAYDLVSKIDKQRKESFFEWVELRPALIKAINRPEPYLTQKAIQLIFEIANRAYPPIEFLFEDSYTKSIFTLLIESQNRENYLQALRLLQIVSQKNILSAERLLDYAIKVYETTDDSVVWEAFINFTLQLAKREDAPKAALANAATNMMKKQPYGFEIAAPLLSALEDRPWWKFW